MFRSTKDVVHSIAVTTIIDIDIEMEIAEAITIIKSELNQPARN